MPLTVRRLQVADADAALRLLDTEPVVNVYLRSEARLGALRSGVWYGVEADGGRLDALCAGGPLWVPWLGDVGLAPLLASALGQLPPPRMIVGPRDHVLALQGARPGWTPREVRDPQPLMVLRRGELRVRGDERVRRGELADLDLLTVAAAAMHREEMGIDPLAIDPLGWRARMAALVERRWSFVWAEGAEIVFKAELSAWTPEVCQVQGVYTDPQRRGRGIGTRGMAAVCERLLEAVPVCSLYVNAYNATAVRLYERLGFSTVADFATVIF